MNTNLVSPGLSLLQPVKAQYGPGLSWADLIVLAGTTALEVAANINIPFCSVGRTDLETPDDGWKHLEPRVTGKENETVELVRDYMAVMGLTPVQFSALLGAGYALGQSDHCDGLFCRRNVFAQSQSGSQPPPSSLLSNVFFNDLLDHNWEPHTTPSRQMFKVREGENIKNTLCPLHCCILVLRLMAPTC